MGEKLALFCLSAIGMLAFTSAYAGEYIPKSYYVIADGHKLETVYLRSKRSLLDLMRKKRGVNYSQSSAAGGGVPSGIPSPEQFFSQNLGMFNPNQGGGGGFPGGSGYGSGSGSGAGAYSFSGAFGSGGGAAHAPGAPSRGHHYSNTGSDTGPQLFSRSGEAYGNGVHVSGSASGQNGAFSSSSATADGTGKVRYSVQTGKY